MFLQNDIQVEGVENAEGKGDMSKTPPNTPDPRNALSPEGIAPGIRHNNNVTLSVTLGKTHNYTWFLLKPSKISTQITQYHISTSIQKEPGIFDKAGPWLVHHTMLFLIWVHDAALYDMLYNMITQ